MKDARLKLILLALVLLTTVGLIANCSSKTKEDTQKPNVEETKNGAKEKEKEEPKENAASTPASNPASVYPGLNMTQLSSKQQTEIVEIAKSELCPCPDSAQSLHECLQDKDKRCNVSLQVAELLGLGVQAGFSKTDILDKVREYVESTKKSHKFAFDNTPFKGNKDAKVVIVEFADFQCPHCKEASKFMKDIMKDHEKDALFYFKNYPLSGHPFAAMAARASLAAYNQGKFWPMHDLLFKHQRELDDAKLMSFAQQLGLNTKKFKGDLLSPIIAGQINRDREEANKAGLTGTPTFYINGKLFVGERNGPEIRKAVEAAIAEAKTTK